MAQTSHDFKRLVLELRPSSPDRVMEVAVELADLLDLDLLGLFLEDPSLRHLAGIPFARELQLLGGGWHPLDVDRLSHDLDVAARGIERMFLAATKRLATKCEFEVVRGSAAELIASLSRAGDIVMIVEPAGLVAQQLPWLAQAASQSAAAIMIVPPHIVRTTGPIAAIASAPDDPAIKIAAAIAAAAKEEPVVIRAYEAPNELATGKPARGPAAIGLKIGQLSPAKIALSNQSALTHALGHLGERLIVLGRGNVEDEVASKIAAARRVPVLLIGRPKPADDEAVT